MMAGDSLLQFEATGVQGELAQQQGGIVSVGEPTVVTQAGHARIGEFAVHNTQYFTYLSNSCLVVSQMTNLQPVL
jgi:hypothetical protein